MAEWEPVDLGVDLTVGDELTGGARLLTRPTEAAMPVYMEVELMVTPTNRQVKCNLPLEDGHWTDRYLQFYVIGHLTNCFMALGAKWERIGRLRT